MTTGRPSEQAARDVATPSQASPSSPGIAGYATELLFCAAWLIGHRDPAPDAVRAAFVRAARHAEALQDGARTREWMYAILRNECLLHPAPLTRIVPLEVVRASIRGGEGETGDDGAALWRAAQALEAPEREIFALSVCARLGVPAVAAVLGVKLGNATVRVARMRQGLRHSLTMLQLARDGYGGCAGLRAVVKDPDAAFSADLRARIEDHARGCDTCGEWPLAPLEAVMVIGPPPPSAAAAVMLPTGFVAEVRAACRGEEEIDLTGPQWTWRPDGFPQPLDDKLATRAVLGLSRLQVAAVGATVLLLVAAVFGTVSAWGGNRPESPQVRPAATLADGGTSTGPAATSGPTASIVVTPLSPTPSASAVPSPASPSVTVPPGTRPPALRPSLALRLSSASVALRSGTTATVFVRLVARGHGTTTWHATVSTAGVRVYPSSGVIAAGSSVYLRLRLSGGREGIKRGLLVVRASSDTARASVVARVGRPPVIVGARSKASTVSISAGHTCKPRRTVVVAQVKDSSPVSVVAVWSPEGRRWVTTRMHFGHTKYLTTIGPFSSRGGHVLVRASDRYGFTTTRAVKLKIVKCR